VAYQTLAPLLLNELQREHKMVQWRQLTARLTAARALDGGSPPVEIAPGQQPGPAQLLKTPATMRAFF
jgi:hypothetical protein